MLCNFLVEVQTYTDSNSSSTKTFQNFTETQSNEFPKLLQNFDEFLWNTSYLGKKFSNVLTKRECEANIF